MNLVVIRSSDIEKSVAFYTALGIHFTKHAHGAGPEHYASEQPELTFEIYPQTDPALATTASRIGFKVANLDARLAALAQQGGRILSAAKDSPWGRRAVLIDPTGHKVELVQAY